MEDKKLDEILTLLKGRQAQLDFIQQEVTTLKQQFKTLKLEFKEMQQARIEDNCYFEEKYYNKISIIFDMLQINDDMRKEDDKKVKKLQRKIDLNSDKIALHDLRIAKLESAIKSN